MNKFTSLDFDLFNQKNVAFNQTVSMTVNELLQHINYLY